MATRAAYNATERIVDFAITAAKLEKSVEYVLEGYKLLGMNRGERRLILKILREVHKIDWKYKVLPLGGMKLMLFLPKSEPKTVEKDIQITIFPYYPSKKREN